MKDRIILGAGVEGEVSVEDGRVIKRFFFPKMNPTAQYLANLKCERFIMPEDLIYEDNRLVAYYMEYIEDAIDAKYITKKGLLESLKLIKEDMRRISANYILIEDMRPKNSLVKDDELYIIDTSLYQISDKSDQYITEYNADSLEGYLRGLLRSGCPDYTSIAKIKPFLVDPMTTINRQMGESETIEEFAIRLARKQ